MSRRFGVRRAAHHERTDRHESSKFLSSTLAGAPCLQAGCCAVIEPGLSSALDGRLIDTAPLFLIRASFAPVFVPCSHSTRRSKLLGPVPTLLHRLALRGHPCWRCARSAHGGNGTLSTLTATGIGVASIGEYHAALTGGSRHYASSHQHRGRHCRKPRVRSRGGLPGWRGCRRTRLACGRRLLLTPQRWPRSVSCSATGGSAASGGPVLEGLSGLVFDPSALGLRRHGPSLKISEA